MATEPNKTNIGSVPLLEQTEARFQGAPRLLFIDAILLAFRLGKVFHEEQKAALIAAARAATDAISFLNALTNFGIPPYTEPHALLGKILSAPNSYRAKYPRVVCSRPQGETPESFLTSQFALYLAEPFLTAKQQKTFYDAYWWFVNNHKPFYLDKKKGRCIGLYATEPKDNESVVPRFEEYLYHLVHNKSVAVSKRFETFPADILMAMYREKFL